MPVHEVLDHAADLIARHGLARDGYGSTYTGWSIDGAIYRTVRVIDRCGMPDVDWGDDEATRRHGLAAAAMAAFVACVNPWLAGSRSAFRLTVTTSEQCASPERAVGLLRRAAAHAKEASQ
jgi:hypothetical protein